MSTTSCWESTWMRPKECTKSRETIRIRCQDGTIWGRRDSLIGMVPPLLERGRLSRMLQLRNRRVGGGWFGERVFVDSTSEEDLEPHLNESCHLELEYHWGGKYAIVVAAPLFVSLPSQRLWTCCWLIDDDDDDDWRRVLQGFEVNWPSTGTKLHPPPPPTQPWPFFLQRASRTWTLQFHNPIPWAFNYSNMNGRQVNAWDLEPTPENISRLQTVVNDLETVHDPRTSNHQRLQAQSVLSCLRPN